jgi:nicotinamidase-related amidase
MLLDTQSVLVLIDVQGKLAQVMHDRETLLVNLQKAVRGTLALGLPVLWLEQNPERMGETVPELKALLAGQAPIPKMSFSCCGAPAFLRQLESLGRHQAILAGIETHVCVYQTATDLLARGFEVEVVADAVSSRRAADTETGLARLQAEGARVTNVEMMLFELMRTAQHPAFRDILKIVR